MFENDEDEKEYAWSTKSYFIRNIFIKVYDWFYAMNILWFSAQINIFLYNLCIKGSHFWEKEPVVKCRLSICR